MPLTIIPNHTKEKKLVKFVVFCSIKIWTLWGKNSLNNMYFIYFLKNH